MSKLHGLIGKLGFTAVGVVVGMVLVSGTGAAAVQFTRTTASEHSIDVIQPLSSHDSSVGTEDTSVRGADDIVPETPEANEPAESPEQADDSSSSASKDSSTGSTGQKSSSDDKAAGAGEPGDDHGKDGGH